MEMKKESSMKMPMGMKIALIAVVMAFGAKADATEREGTVIRAGIETLGDGIQRRLVFRVDTTGNRMPDTALVFPSPSSDYISRDLQGFVERGMRIVFDDEGYRVLPNGNTQVDGFNAISIDGSNMIDLFPNEAARFKYATTARQRAQTQATQSPPAPATQETAEERRIRELEEELRRLREGR